MCWNVVLSILNQASPGLQSIAAFYGKGRPAVPSRYSSNSPVNSVPISPGTTENPSRIPRNSPVFLASFRQPFRKSLDYSLRLIHAPINLTFVLCPVCQNLQFLQGREYQDIAHPFCLPSCTNFLHIHQPLSFQRFGSPQKGKNEGQQDFLPLTYHRFCYSLVAIVATDAILCTS